MRSTLDRIQSIAVQLSKCKRNDDQTPRCPASTVRSSTDLEFESQVSQDPVLPARASMDPDYVASTMDRVSMDREIPLDGELSLSPPSAQDNDLPNESFLPENYLITAAPKFPPFQVRRRRSHHEQIIEHRHRAPFETGMYEVVTAEILPRRASDSAINEHISPEEERPEANHQQVDTNEKKMKKKNVRFSNEVMYRVIDTKSGSLDGEGLEPMNDNWRCPDHISQSKFIALFLTIIFTVLVMFYVGFIIFMMLK